MSATTLGGSTEPLVSQDRCDANRSAGKITFLTGYDFAAAASIVEVVYAKQLGLYDQLCLDVELTSSFSSANYALVEGGQGTFASGGSFSEVIGYAAANGSKLAVVQVDGLEPIDTLILKPGYDTIESVEGQTIGVKGKLPPSVQVMLSNAGLTLGTDYETVLLDGFNPVAHYEIESIAGFPGWRSNEPYQLEGAKLPFTQYNAADTEVPGSFGVIFTTQDFINNYPSAAADFVRATMKGLEMAIADPTAAAQACVAQIEGNGNPNFLSPDGEVFRWTTESQIVGTTQASGNPAGWPDADALQREVDAYTPTGLFAGVTLPAVTDIVATSLVEDVVTDGSVDWPG